MNFYCLKTVSMFKLELKSRFMHKIFSLNKAHKINYSN